MEFENSICGRGRVGYHGESFVSNAMCFDVLLYFIGGLVNSCTVSVLFTDADAGLEDDARDIVYLFETYLTSNRIRVISY